MDEEENFFLGGSKFFGGRIIFLYFFLFFFRVGLKKVFWGVPIFFVLGGGGVHKILGWLQKHEKVKKHKKII